MMDGLVRLLLTVGLVLSALAAFTASLRIMMGYLVGTEWYWGGVIAAYAGPAVFAGALYLDELRRRVQLDRWLTHPDNAAKSAEQTSARASTTGTQNDA